MRIARRGHVHDAGARVITITLAFTVTVSYGVLLYAFPVMFVPMQAEPGWTPALLTGGFSAAALAAGVAAIPVGATVDRYGPRAVMTTGSTLAAVLLLLWSRVQAPAAYVLVWIGLGACMAAVFYEPAFAAVARFGAAERTRAIAIITIAGGLASTIFVPVASALVDALGWRGAVQRLALTLAVTTILPHALTLRPTDGPSGSGADGDFRTRAASPAMYVPAGRALRSGAFGWMSIAFVLVTAVNFALTVHLVPLLIERGHSAKAAAAALALLGLAKLPGRMMFAPLVSRMSARTALLWMIALQVVGLVVLATTDGVVGLSVFVAAFGAGDGASTPARAELIAELFGPLDYGRIGGALAFVVSVGRAAGPVGVSLVRGVSGYGGVLWLLGALTAAAAAALTRCILSQRVPSTIMTTHST